jgi:hypothetical protein
MRRVLSAISLLIAITGCTRYWAKPNGTLVELEAAKTRCETEAVTRFPLVPTNVLTGYAVPAGSRCSVGPGGPSCVTYGGTEIDLNGQPRSEAFQGCLVAAGWVPAKDEEAAKAIARSSRVPAPSEAALRDARQWCDKMFNQRRNAGVMEVFHDNLDQCVATHARDLD